MAPVNEEYYERRGADAGLLAGREQGYRRGVQDTLDRLAADIRRHVDPEQDGPVPLYDEIEGASGFAISAVFEFVDPRDLSEGIARYVESFATPERRETT